MIKLRETLEKVRLAFETSGIDYALIGLKIQAYKNDSQRELQDKADIQSLLKIPGINLKLVKQYADLFGEWGEIESLMP